MNFLCNYYLFVLCLINLCVAKDNEGRVESSIISIDRQQYKRIITQEEAMDYPFSSFAKKNFQVPSKSSLGKKRQIGPLERMLFSK